MSKKIVIIGAGSASFGPTTMATLIRSQILTGSTIALVDLDQKNLDSMALLATRLNEEWQAGMNVIASTNRRDLLTDADFVVVSIEVPPRETLWRLDWEIPLKHGLRQPYGENGGPGGLMHTFRQVAPFMQIVRDMEDLCPKALLINFSNPLPRIMRAVTKYSGIKIVGKCHQINVGYAIATVLLASYLDFEIPEDIDLHSDPKNTTRTREIASFGKDRLDIKAFGLNHFTWMLDVRDRLTGENLYPRMQEAIDVEGRLIEPLSMELFRLFGYCPVPGDSHLCEYLPWAHDEKARSWEQFNLRLYDWEGNINQRTESWESIEALVQGQKSLDVLRDSHSEGASEIIEAIASDGHFYDQAVNITNRGAISNLPDEAIVELPALVSRHGVEAIFQGPLPEPIAELCRREVALVEFVVDAAVTGNRDLALQAMLMDPMINDIGRAKAILNDYLTEFAAYLPQFAS